MKYWFRCLALLFHCGLFWPALLKADCAGEMPKLIHQITPEYPSVALKRKIEGFLSIGLSINAAGMVVSADVPFEKQSLLKTASLSAVRQWRYSPTPGLNKEYTFSKWISIDFSIKNGIGVVSVDHDSIGPISDDFRESPRLIHGVEPIIPKNQKVKEGKIWAQVDINAKGQVIHACIMLTDDPSLDDLVVAAIYQWRYKIPARDVGKHFHYSKTVSLKISAH
jgi:outer membrane biosynthesis protein TonB